MSKVLEFLSEWWIVILTVIFGIVFIGAIVWVILSPKLTEGIVTNKWYFPGYSSCTEKGCEYNPARWIVNVRNGEDTDSWYVSESYYDSVHIGDYVRK